MIKSFCIFLFLYIISPESVWAQENRQTPKGITFSVGYGLMHQQDQVAGPAVRLGQGINVGVGGYLRDDLALFIRASTNQNTLLQRGPFEEEYKQSSLFLGTSLQYWMSRRFYVEGGSE